MTFRTVALIALLSASTALEASQQPAVEAPVAPQANERRTVRALRLQTGEAIVLDGRLDEEVWSRAVPARDFPWGAEQCLELDRPTGFNILQH